MQKVCDTHATLGFDKQNQHSSAEEEMDISSAQTCFVWRRLTSYLFGRAPFAATISLRMPLVGYWAVVDIVPFATTRTADITFSRFPPPSITNGMLRRAVPN